MSLLHYWDDGLTTLPPGPISSKGFNLDCAGATDCGSYSAGYAGAGASYN